MKLHKRNKGTELVPCKEKTEVFTLKSNTNVSDGAGESSGERKTSSSEGGLAAGHTMASKIETIYKMIKEIKSEMIGKDLIKKVITEAIDEEMDRVRQKIQDWKEVKLESLVSDTIEREMKKITDALPTLLNISNESKCSGIRKEEELQRSCVE